MVDAIAEGDQRACDRREQHGFRRRQGQRFGKLAADDGAFRTGIDDEGHRDRTVDADRDGHPCRTIVDEALPFAQRIDRTAVWRGSDCVRFGCRDLLGAERRGRDKDEGSKGGNSSHLGPQMSRHDRPGCHCRLLPKSRTYALWAF